MTPIRRAQCGFTWQELLTACVVVTGALLFSECLAASAYASPPLSPESISSYQTTSLTAAGGLLVLAGFLARRRVRRPSKIFVALCIVFVIIFLGNSFLICLRAAMDTGPYGTPHDWP